LRTLNSDPDHAILKKFPSVPIGDIFLFALVIMSPVVFQIILTFWADKRPAGASPSIQSEARVGVEPLVGIIVYAKRVTPIAEKA
jgi:hypothetical protein